MGLLYRYKRKLFKYIEYLQYDPEKYWEQEGGEKYFNNFHTLSDRNEEVFLEEIEKAKPNSVLDLGCGYGRYLKVINDRFPNIKLTGCEISQSQINRAIKFLNNEEIDLVKTDGKSLPLKDKAFDLVITYGCLSLVKQNDLIKFYQEIERVAHKGLFLEYYVKGEPLRHHIYHYNYDYYKLFNKQLIKTERLGDNGDTLWYVDLSQSS